MSTLIVTGASRGLGRSVARELAAALRPANVVLVARSRAGVEETGGSVRAVLGSACVVDCVEADLSNGDGVAKTVEHLRRHAPTADGSVLVNNAGLLSPLGGALALATGDPRALFADVQRACAVNLSSAFVLSASFAALCGQRGVASLAVNVSSLAAVRPFVSWGAYCATKAALDMQARVLALEAEAYGWRIRTLNYAPGPLDTDMQADIRGNANMDPQSRDAFRQLHAEGKLVSPDDSARALARVLKADAFESGAHVDYYEC